MKVYFGHPVSTFGTHLEETSLRAIQKFFQDATIINPADPAHRERYEQWKAERGDGMAYYVEEVLTDVEVGVFLPFEDGMYGAGMALEAEQLDELYEMNRKQEIRDIAYEEIDALTVEETKERLS